MKEAEKINKPQGNGVSPCISGSLVSPDAIQKEAERFQKATANKMAIERTAFAQGALWVSLFIHNER